MSPAMVDLNFRLCAALFLSPYDPMLKLGKRATEFIKRKLFD